MESMVTSCSGYIPGIMPEPRFSLFRIPEVSAVHWFISEGALCVSIVFPRKLSDQPSGIRQTVDGVNLWRRLSAPLTSGDALWCPSGRRPDESGLGRRERLRHGAQFLAEPGDGVRSGVVRSHQVFLAGEEHFFSDDRKRARS